MLINDIVISTDSFHSENKYDIVSSNNQYITKLFQKNIEEDRISEDALKSYYVDYYLSHISHSGFQKSMEVFLSKSKTIYYIQAGLKALKTENHLNLFQKACLNQENDYAHYDQEFQEIQESENLLHINHRWLMNHPQLIIIHHEYMDKKVEEHIEAYKHDKRHLQIIKQLCHIINEEFISVTAGDINNIYHNAWYFKTTKNAYYIIEKDNIVTLYNSYNKQEITKGRLISNKTGHSSISNFISKMLA
ncbi:MAG: Unknown protein [uncultured Sulfurovum sp.]|uniref:DNA mimic protein DMP19 C-terminal domain-containing protein n=1 Tax=uncultured Sulfurovum sp. TaxID=269237 RepID=A0A6S6SY46_9BACT|nr:MAG: Unknown protein [uncultured Sulfurovum sp.]